MFGNNNHLSAVVVHGYGGNKEEMLGLSFHLSKVGINTYTIDLRGHGENSEYYCSEVLSDLNEIVRKLKEKSKIIVIGHSLGGRLALISDADYRIGISPALNQVFSEQTISIINNLRRYRVNEKIEDINFKILQELPLFDNRQKQTDFILFGTRDVPEIKEACLKLKESLNNVIEVPWALHSDIFTSNTTFRILKEIIEQNYWL